jgi:hypothetical protein
MEFLGGSAVLLLLLRNLGTQHRQHNTIGIMTDLSKIPVIVRVTSPTRTV